MFMLSKKEERLKAIIVHSYETNVDFSSGALIVVLLGLQCVPECERKSYH